MAAFQFIDCAFQSIVNGMRTGDVLLQTPPNPLNFYFSKPKIASCREFNFEQNCIVIVKII